MTTTLVWGTKPLPHELSLPRSSAHVVLGYPLPPTSASRRHQGGAGRGHLSGAGPRPSRGQRAAAILRGGRGEGRGGGPGQAPRRNVRAATARDRRAPRAPGAPRRPRGPPALTGAQCGRGRASAGRDCSASGLFISPPPAVRSDSLDEIRKPRHSQRTWRPLLDAETWGRGN